MRKFAWKKEENLPAMLFNCSNFLNRDICIESDLSRQEDFIESIVENIEREKTENKR